MERSSDAGLACRAVRGLGGVAHEQAFGAHVDQDEFPAVLCLEPAAMSLVDLASPFSNHVRVERDGRHHNFSVARSPGHLSASASWPKLMTSLGRQATGDQEPLFDVAEYDTR